MKRWKFDLGKRAVVWSFWYEIMRMGWVYNDGYRRATATVQPEVSGYGFECWSNVGGIPESVLSGNVEGCGQLYICF
jgi:hypothetical protein